MALNFDTRRIISVNVSIDSSRRVSTTIRNHINCYLQSNERINQISSKKVHILISSQYNDDADGTIEKGF